MEPILGGQPSQGDGASIKDSDTAHFVADVIDASREVPIIVDFWAPWCGPCKQLTPALEKAVNAAGGKVRLVKVNIDENQDLAQQMRIQSIPAVYAFRDGQPVDGFMGAVPESQVKAFVEKLAGPEAVGPSPVEQALEQAKAAFENGDTGTAAAIYGQVLNHEPDNLPAAGGLARCRVVAGDLDQARQILDSLPAEAAEATEVAAARSALELAEQAGAVAGDIAELQAQVDREPANHQARYDLAVALYAANQAEAAISELIEIVRRDRAWNDEAARKQLVQIFEALGQTHELTMDGRRRLSTVLFS